MGVAARLWPFMSCFGGVHIQKSWVLHFPCSNLHANTGLPQFFFIKELPNLFGKKKEYFPGPSSFVMLLWCVFANKRTSAQILLQFVSSDLVSTYSVSCMRMWELCRYFCASVVKNWFLDQRPSKVFLTTQGFCSTALPWDDHHRSNCYFRWKTS